MKIIGKPIPNIPWYDRPEGSNEIMWRYENNPIIQRDCVDNCNSIFNSAVVSHNGEFAGVFRCDNKARQMNIHVGFSKDGINWKIENQPVNFLPSNDDILMHSDYKYDPRVVFIEDRYYVLWCNGYHGPTIGIGYTFDFKKFYQMENVFLPYNRNGVLFPRKINNHYIMLSRPSDTGHTAFGDIFLSHSKDLIYWGRHRHIMGVAPFEDSAWQCLKIGAGPAPIETSHGWLLFYHGVLRSCNGYVYSMGCALLDLDEPWKVIARSREYLLSPQKYYECVGDVPNVVFPCAALACPETGKITVYYGGADTVVALAFCKLDELIPWLMENKLST